MNYLAHLQLSGSDMSVAVGNFIGDGVKGRIKKEFPPMLTVGLYLHRFIDSMTDEDPVNAVGRRELYDPEFGKYAGVAQDMIHDHFLALRWSDYEERELSIFLESFFEVADSYLSYFPIHQLRFMQAAREGGWLANYQDLDAMSRAFNGLSKRITRDNPLHRGGAFLKTHHAALEEQFHRFYPSLQMGCVQELERLLTTL